MIDICLCQERRGRGGGEERREERGERREERKKGKKKKWIDERYPLVILESIIGDAMLPLVSRLACHYNCYAVSKKKKKKRLKIN